MLSYVILCYLTLIHLMSSFLKSFQVILGSLWDDVGITWAKMATDTPHHTPGHIPQLTPQHAPEPTPQPTLLQTHTLRYRKYIQISNAKREFHLFWHIFWNKFLILSWYVFLLNSSIDFILFILTRVCNWWFVIQNWNYSTVTLGSFWNHMFSMCRAVPLKGWPSALGFGPPGLW